MSILLFFVRANIELLIIVREMIELLSTGATYLPAKKNKIKIIIYVVVFRNNKLGQTNTVYILA